MDQNFMHQQQKSAKACVCVEISAYAIINHSNRKAVNVNILYRAYNKPNHGIDELNAQTQQQPSRINAHQNQQ